MQGGCIDVMISAASLLRAGWFVFHQWDDLLSLSMVNAVLKPT